MFVTSPREESRDLPLAVSCSHMPHNSVFRIRSSLQLQYKTFFVSTWTVTSRSRCSSYPDYAALCRSSVRFCVLLCTLTQEDDHGFVVVGEGGAYFDPRQAVVGFHESSLTVTATIPYRCIR